MAYIQSFLDLGHKYWYPIRSFYLTSAYNLDRPSRTELSIQYSILDARRSCRTLSLTWTIFLCLFFAIRLNCNFCNVFLDLVNDFVLTRRYCNAIARLCYAVPEEVLELRPLLSVASRKDISASTHFFQHHFDWGEAGLEFQPLPHFFFQIDICRPFRLRVNVRFCRCSSFQVRSYTFLIVLVTWGCDCKVSKSFAENGW